MVKFFHFCVTSHCCTYRYIYTRWHWLSTTVCHDAVKS